MPGYCTQTARPEMKVHTVADEVLQVLYRRHFGGRSGFEGEDGVERRGREIEFADGSNSPMQLKTPIMTH
jgi:hypothetical protein